MTENPVASLYQSCRSRRLVALLDEAITASSQGKPPEKASA